MAMLPLLQRLGSLFNRKHAQGGAQAPAAAAPTATPMASQGSPWPQSNSTGSPSPSAGSATASGGYSGATVLSDPIVAQANQELAAQQTQPVPTEDEQLQAEQHTAWAAYDFERSIVIFSRLMQLHPEEAAYKEKLVASYFNRGKQYEEQGDERRATQLYYSAIALDPDFTPAKEAAEQFLAKVGES